MKFLNTNFLLEFKVHKGGMQAWGDSNFIELEKLQIVWSCSWHVSIGNFLDIQCQMFNVYWNPKFNLLNETSLILNIAFNKRYHLVMYSTQQLEGSATRGVWISRRAPPTIFPFRWYGRLSRYCVQSE